MACHEKFRCGLFLILISFVVISEATTKALKQNHLIRSISTDILSSIEGNEVRDTYKKRHGSLYTDFNINFPMNDLTVFQKFEEVLKQEDRFDPAVTELTKIGGDNNYNFVKRVMTSLISNEEASGFSWLGREGKRPFHNLLMVKLVLSNRGTQKLSKHSPSDKEETNKEIRYETAYACEGKVLKIECRNGELIKLIRANYGRFSITICNDHGNTDWSVNCMSPKSLRVLHSRCSNKQNCTIDVTDDTFGGDPCPGTSKYIEMHYNCKHATTTTTTSRPSPPWLITSQPPAWSTVRLPLAARPAQPAAAPTAATTTAAAHTDGAGERPFDSYDEEERDAGASDDPTTLRDTEAPQRGPSKDSTADDLPSHTSPSVLPSWTNYGSGVPISCSPKTVRSILWSWTKVNSTSIQPCPGGTTGFAKWHCVVAPGDQPRWFPPDPDLSECRSVWLTSLEQRIIAGRDPLVSITNDLAQVTSSKTLYGGDMMITTKIIQKMTEKMSNDIQTVNDPMQREQIVTEMLIDVAKTGSNLLDASQHASWKDLSYKEQMSVATSLLIGLEENAFLLADTVNSEKTVEKVFKNILLSVRVLDLKSLKSETFPSGSHRRGWHASDDSVELPQRALAQNSNGNLVRLVFVAFDRLEEILQWQPEGYADYADQSNLSKVLNSKVISASLGKGRHIQLKEPVKLTLRHLRTENVSNPTCVFWDYTANAWSEEGCRVEASASNMTHTVCYCDHLTNFAVLMDVHAVYLSMPHEIALQIITYVGCVVSIVCLVLAIITFQLFRGLKSDRTTIHCNLCVCLLVAEVIFLLGIGQTDNAILCGVIAGFLHYFFLSAFIWMFFEGFQLYVMLIEVFEAEKSRIRWYYFFAYGLPFLIVCISATISPQGYGTQRHCWLQTDNYFIYSFVGPVFIVIVLNVVFLIMAIFMMCRHSSNSLSLKSKEHSRLASTRTWLKGAFILVFLLGLTWTFGFLYLNKESVAMAYLFATLNSLQGFFIFLFHCIQNEKVRKEYRKFIRRNGWLPKCLLCSSAGSTGGATSSGSSGVSKERRTSLFGGSGSNSNPPGGGANLNSTDNSVLTPHGASNISFKSCSRDSGHCGLEKEDPAQLHQIATDPGYNLTLTNHRMRPGRNYPLEQPKNSHTYTEILESHRLREFVEDDPVYEEIDPSEVQISNTSRMSSRSYSDHRPLIPYSPGNEPSYADNSYRRRNMAAVRSLAAVLDGKTVVCHLEPQEMCPGDAYLARTLD